jgi:phospholipid transport system transporter-binding protein
MTQLTIQSNGHALLTGDIDFASVTALQQEGFALLAAHSELTVDFSAVGRSGSAAAALLIAWLRCAKAEQKVLHLVNMPANLQRVLRVSGLAELIG